jgi:spiro-SPASM protein
VLAKPALSLVIESCALGWRKEVIEQIKAAAVLAPERKNGMAPLSWIITPDDGGTGEGEAAATAKALSEIFAGDVYVQAIRIKGEGELEKTEKFYRYWTAYGGEAESVKVIIQQHDSYCGFLPELRAADISPVKRFPCWHLLRDFPILLNGDVVQCKEDICGVLGAAPLGEGVAKDRNAGCSEGETSPTKKILGNVFSEGLQQIWERGERLYLQHTTQQYGGLCKDCDEYYTFNF